MKPGTYQSFTCLSDADCTDAECTRYEKHTEASLMLFPGNEAAPRDIAYPFKFASNLARPH